MSNYFRITAYHPIENLSAIFDTNGMFNKIWEFSAFLISKGFKILQVGDDTQFLDINIEKAEAIPDKIILRATSKGKPSYIEYTLNGKIYRAVQVEDKQYIPER